MAGWLSDEEANKRSGRTSFGQIQCTLCHEMIVWAFDEAKRMALQFDLRVPIVHLSKDGRGDPIASKVGSYYAVPHHYVCKARPEEPVVESAMQLSVLVEKSMKNRDDQINVMSKSDLDIKAIFKKFKNNAPARVRNHLFCYWGDGDTFKSAIDNMEDVLKLNILDLMKQRGFGRKSIQWIRDFLKENGLPDLNY